MLWSNGTSRRGCSGGSGSGRGSGGRSRCACRGGSNPNAASTSLDTQQQATHDVAGTESPTSERASVVEWLRSLPVVPQSARTRANLALLSRLRSEDDVPAAFGSGDLFVALSEWLCGAPINSVRSSEARIQKRIQHRIQKRIQHRI